MKNNDNDLRIVKPKPRCKKLRPRIDLAAMVSVSFLLIIFFMVTKELAKPQAMDLGLPGGCDDCGGDYGCIDHRRVLTLLLDDNNQIISYRGLLEFPDTTPRLLKYGKDGIGKQLVITNKKIIELTGRNDRTIVIIKPSKKCSYGNLVDILDEMAINKIATYAIVNDFTPEEQKLLASN